MLDDAMKFWKMHGLGNDFVVLEGPVAVSAADVARLCDRRRGIGADGVLVVSAGERVRMEYWNADGTPAEMCGNGLRCVARFARDRGLVAAAAFEVDTPVGLRRVEVARDTVRAELGRATVAGTTDIDGRTFHLANVGNPHAVTLVDDPAITDVAGIGSAVERDPMFPGGTNVEFVHPGREAVSVRVWERGVGETLACGTGAVATAAVAHHLGLAGDRVAIDLPGGRATVELEDATSWLIGPAVEVFSGTWPG